MNGIIKTETVDLGTARIKIPMATIAGKKSGVSLLVTAGMDGDEYAGIDAAYELVDTYKSRNFSGNLTVIPIVNIPGFEAGTSQNPQDRKFPKHFFPGSPSGTSSERMISWLVRNHIPGVSVWIDLHGASVYERLRPVAMLFETKNKIVNRRTEQIIHALPERLITYEKSGVWGGKPERVAKFGVSYVFSESGDLGAREREWIDIHLERIESVMAVLGMIKKTIPKTQKHVYRSVQEIHAQKSGLWFPNRKAKQMIKKGMLLGEIRNYEGRVIQSINFQENGEFLWGMEKTWCTKGETLIGLGSDSEVV